MSNSAIKISIGKGDTLLDISVNGTHQAITLDMLKGIWKNISEDELSDIEYSNAEVYNNYIVCCVTVAQGQGGIVFVWDTQAQKFIHYSNGEFAVKAVIQNNKVYVLRQVAYWGVTAHLELDYCPLGTIAEDNEITGISLDENTKFHLANNPDNYAIYFDGDIPTIKIENE